MSRILELVRFIRHLQAYGEEEREMEALESEGPEELEEEQAEENF